MADKSQEFLSVYTVLIWKLHIYSEYEKNKLLQLFIAKLKQGDPLKGPAGEGKVSARDRGRLDSAFRDVIGERGTVCHLVLKVEV